MEVARRLKDINEYYFSKKLREIEDLNRAGKAIINLGIGSPDLPPHPSVIETLREESAKPNVHGYQNYKGSIVLREAMSKWYKKWYGVELDAASEILPLIGSKEGIMHICMTYLNKGDGVLVPNPGYPTYTSAVKLAGGKPVFYSLKEENNWYPDLRELQSLMDANYIKLLFINYPSMPTGQKGNEKLFSNLVALAKKKGIVIVHDNPYSFILSGKPLSALAPEGAKDVVIELNSLSKSHNMAGWRVGMMCANKERIEDVLRFKSNMDSGMFLPLQLAAAKALELGEDWHEEVNKIYSERREGVYRLLDALHCMYNKDQAGLFVWARVPETFGDGYALSDEVLYKSNVFITPGGIFGSAGSKYIRVSLCTPLSRIEEAEKRIIAS